MQMPDAVRIEHETAHAARLVTLNWVLGNTCNYACSYCSNAQHDGTIPWLPIRQVRLFCDQFIEHHAGRPVHAEFTGGEVTLYRGLPELAAHLRGRGATVGIISNGSRTLRFWESLATSVDHVDLSYHIEYANEEHFTRVARVLVSAGVRVNVNVMMLQSRFAEARACAQRLARNLDNVTIAIQPLRDTIAGRLVQYTPAQISDLSNAKFPELSNLPQRSVCKGRMIAVFADGSRQVIESSVLIATGKNRWRDWSCRAGLDQLVVDPAGWIWIGWCKVGGAIGHITDCPILFPTSTAICTRDACHCALDVMNYRERRSPS